MWNIQKPYNQDKPIVGSYYFSAEKSLNISRENVGLNKEGIRAVEAGLFTARVNGVNRFLPRALVRDVAVTTGSNQVQIKQPEVFKTGDVLYALQPEGLITLGGVWAAGDTVTIRFNEPSLGLSTSYTHTLVGADLNALDDELIATLNLATNPLSSYATFTVGALGEINVLSKGLVFNISVTEGAAGTGTATVTNQLNAEPRLVGTVAAIDHANQTLTLAANAAVGVPVNGQIGTLTEEIYGLYNHSIDFTDKTYCVIKAIDRCDRIYTAALPYFDEQLRARFPRMKFV